MIPFGSGFGFGFGFGSTEDVFQIGKITGVFPASDSRNHWWLNKMELVPWDPSEERVSFDVRGVVRIYIAARNIHVPRIDQVQEAFRNKPASQQVVCSILIRA